MSTDNPDFNKAVMLVSSFKGDRFRRCQAHLLRLGLIGMDFSGADLGEDLTDGDVHISGTVVGSLLRMELVEYVGRIKNPKASAHGRKLNLLRIPNKKRALARSFLERNGYAFHESAEQKEMAFA